MPVIEVVGARGNVADPEELYGSLNGREEVVVALNPAMVCGRQHLLSAAMHALRAFERGTNSSTSLGIETLLYASGERQISHALDKMGIAEEMKGVALILFDADPDEVIDALQMSRDDGLLDCDPERVLAFGIGEDEIRSVPDELMADLVLERVAFVEMLKR